MLQKINALCNNPKFNNYLPHITLLCFKINLLLSQNITYLYCSTLVGVLIKGANLLYLFCASKRQPGVLVFIIFGADS